MFLDVIIWRSPSKGFLRDPLSWHPGILAGFGNPKYNVWSIAIGDGFKDVSNYLPWKLRENDPFWRAYSLFQSGTPPKAKRLILCVQTLVVSTVASPIFFDTPSQDVDRDVKRLHVWLREFGISCRWDSMWSWGFQCIASGAWNLHGTMIYKLGVPFYQWHKSVKSNEFFLLSCWWVHCTTIKYYQK